MPADADLPPSCFARWITQHKSLVRTAAAAYFVAASASAIWPHLGHGWDLATVLQLVTALCVGTAWWAMPVLYERNVTQYDRTHSNP